MKKYLVFPVIAAGLIFLTAGMMAEDEAVVQKLIARTVEKLGGQKFLQFKNYTGNGRVFSIKRDGQSWTKFWEYYQTGGLSRVDYDKQYAGLSEIYNLPLGKGWNYEYGKVKPMKESELKKFRLSEKKNLFNLFRDRYREPGMKIFYYGPGQIDDLKPLEALEFIDTENFSVTVYYEEGSALPYKLEYNDRNDEGIALKKAEMYFRWFTHQGIQSPMRIEFYSNGRETGLVEYSAFTFNTVIPESLFLEPAPKTK